MISTSANHLNFQSAQTAPVTVQAPPAGAASPAKSAAKKPAKSAAKKPARRKK